MPEIPPAPRCTPHVRARLDSAHRRLDSAQASFDANPAITRNRQRLDAAKANLDARSAEYDATPPADKPSCATNSAQRTIQVSEKSCSVASK